MHSEPDALPPTTAPSPARRPFSEHTVFSLLRMVLVSAGVLWGVDRALEEEVKVVQQWDFSTPAGAETPWTFPATDQARTPSGIAYTATQTGPGPALTLSFDAATVHTIRVTMAVSRVEDGRSLPFALEWYWASPEDVAAAGEGWPFSTDRGTPFFQPDRHVDEVKMLRIEDHPRWRGPIAKAFLSVKLPNSAVGPFRIETRKIEFLE